MVRNWLPIRSVQRDGDVVSTADTMSTTSDFTEWTTTTSTIQADSEVLSSSDDLALSIHVLPNKDGLITKITPPTVPVQRINHVPCDIVLVIDVSGSMGSNAPIPASPGEEVENYGLSVLDLVKHASRTILKSLDEGDRLGIVTFASRIRVLQKLTPMTEANKEEAEQKIDSMHPMDATNLWQGLLEGIKMVREGGEVNTGRVPAIFVLTDGMPNHMCPPQGYVPKIRAMEQLPASVHTFGFGYSLRSGLLKSIAEIGGGNYAFIPDAGMIGTVFIHAVANLQATYATNAILRLTYPSAVELEETTGDSVDKQEILTLPDEEGEPRQLTILLGNLQYGQPRDIYLRMKTRRLAHLETLGIHASLDYSRMTSAIHTKRVSQSFGSFTTLPESEIAYHISRSQICNFLASIIPIRSDGEHQALGSIQQAQKDQLRNLITRIPARNFPDDPKNNSLLEDLSGPEPKGQVSLALSRPDFYSKWGVHYLPSLLNAHTRQICNTFKDSGPLQYGVDSPLFVTCRNKLDNVFDNLPPPKPSNYRSATHRGNFSMSKYNSARGVCFAGSTLVRLASGKEITISSLRKGAVLSTPLGSRSVVAILKTPVMKEVMCRVGALIVTPWHPISLDAGMTWVFPAQIASSAVRYTGSIYSILLQPDENADAHSIQLTNDILGVTLGHGIMSGEDARAHPFFGDYAAVTTSLKAIGINRMTGIAIGAGVKRDAQTGLVSGFKKGKTTAAVMRRMLGRVKVQRPGELLYKDMRGLVRRMKK